MHWLTRLHGCVDNQYRHYFGVRPIDDIQHDLLYWFDLPLGRRMLSQQQQFLDTLLPELFGYHLLQMSVLGRRSLFAQSPANHRFALSPYAGQHPDYSISWLKSAFEHLPIDQDMVDVTVLHHVLDYSTTPQQLLREAVRVTIPNGYIIIVGFNPLGSLGLAKPFGCLLSHSAHWHYRCLRIGRLKDWFEVLGLTLLQCHHGDYHLPLQQCYMPRLERLGQKLLLPGSFYILVTRKTTIPMTMVKSSQWKTRPGILRPWDGVITRVDRP